MKLYELTDSYNRLLEMAEEMDAETFQDTLESVEESINEKAENIAKLLRNMQGDIEVLKSEEKRLKQRRMSLESKQDYLKFYLQSELEKAGLDKVKSAHFSISLRNNPPKVSVLDETLIPEHYFITKPQLDKKSLKEALKNGEQIDGVTLEVERSVSIR